MSDDDFVSACVRQHVEDRQNSVMDWFERVLWFCATLGALLMLYELWCVALWLFG